MPKEKEMPTKWKVWPTGQEVVTEQEFQARIDMQLRNARSVYGPERQAAREKLRADWQARHTLPEPGTKEQRPSAIRETVPAR
jgi:hypothetical protein